MSRERVSYFIDTALWQQIFKVYRESNRRYCNSTVVARDYMLEKSKIPYCHSNVAAKILSV